MTREEYISFYQAVRTRYTQLINNIDIDSLILKKTKHQKASTDSDFWIDNVKAKKTLKIISLFEKEIKEYNTLKNLYEDVTQDYELLELGEELSADMIDNSHSFSNLLNKYETKKMLSGENDNLGAIISIHPGAGGTESQDWVKMLFRMYTRWLDSNNYKYKIVDLQDGDEGGIKEATLEIDEEYLYGLLSSESGVHRLVRISPFDSNSRRHTSFAAVFVFPLISDDIDVNISDSDIRIDTYRASGAGGQHVNKTDSAVRITHLETGIVVQCQNQRSQLKNKQTAIKLLKSKLFQYELDIKNTDLKKMSSDKKSIEWGSQIRSYVFHPYNLVKDHRTKHETSNINLVMDGEIDNFIRNYLLHRMETK